MPGISASCVIPDSLSIVVNILAADPDAPEA
jgi:hypothetical protein